VIETRDSSNADADSDHVEDNDIATSALMTASFVARPPLAEDRTAQMLGLVPDPSQSLDSKRLKTARMAAGLGVEKLASRLRERGWTTKPLDVIQWEAGQSSGVPPAVIAAIADELNIEPDRLTRTAVEATSRLERLRESALLQSLVDRIAQAKSLSQDAAFALLERSQPSFAYRGNPDDEQYLRILERFVEQLEGGKN
jgi:transcriptional regulator with XRE-family HTH domain